MEWESGGGVVTESGYARPRGRHRLFLFLDVVLCAVLCLLHKQPTLRRTTTATGRFSDPTLTLDREIRLAEIHHHLPGVEDLTISQYRRHHVILRLGNPARSFTSVPRSFLGPTKPGTHQYSVTTCHYFLPTATEERYIHLSYFTSTLRRRRQSCLVPGKLNAVG
jgi:hypothetical protein